MSQTEFKYGWCTTDDKKGKEIRTNFRKADYMKDAPYDDVVKAMLEQMGLPFPEDAEIFRGTHHDLLFLDSHGVVIRIGPLDVKDLMNPAIIQPLGWLETKSPSYKQKLPFTVAIYPGIPLYKHFQDKEGIEYKETGRFLLRSKQASVDAGRCVNLGVMAVETEEGAKNYKILLDPDNRFNGSSEYLTEKRDAAMEELSPESDNKADLISRMIAKVFAEVSGFKGWQAVFEQHQPLRELFWRGFKDEQFDPEAQPDQEALAAFWDKCASLVNAPQTMRYPVWHMQEAAEGETPVFVREEVDIPLVLYRPWTGNEADVVNVAAPVKQTAAIKDAVAAAHAEKIGSKPKTKTLATLGV